MKCHYRRSAAAAVFISALVTTACPAHHGAGPVPGPTPIRGGTLRVLFASDVDSLDPNRAAQPPSWFFARALARGLLAFPNVAGAAGANPVPDLASAMPSVSQDGLTYTFHLRSGVSFGPPASRAITSADVIASIARARASGVGIAPALAVIARMQTPDRSTVVLTLSRRAPYLPWLLAQPQTSVVPAGTPARADVTKISPSGPYRIESYQPERALTLVRDPAWGNDPVRHAYVDRIRATFHVSRARGLAAIGSGDADLIVDPGPPDQGRLAPPSDLRVLRAPGACVRYIAVDDRFGPLRILGARRAIAASVRRALLGPHPAPRVLPPTVVGASSSPVIPEDLAAARNDLSRAHLSRGFSTTILAADAPRDRAEVAALRRSLARARITLHAHLVDPALLPAEPPAPLALRSWCADWPGESGANVLGAAGAGVRERAFARASVAAPGSAAAWAAADAALVASARVIPLQWPDEIVPLSSRIQGVTGAPMWPRGDPANCWFAP